VKTQGGIFQIKVTLTKSIFSYQINAYQEKLFTNIPVFAIGEGTASYL
jgi:hypothetical protein